MDQITINTTINSKTTDLLPILGQLKTYFIENYQNNLETMILFGSQARGDASPDSDIDILVTGQCEVLGKSTSLLGFQPPTSFTPLPDSQSLKGFQCKAFRHFVKMSDRELRTLQLVSGLTQT